MTSLPLISHRMFVAAIQEDNGIRPSHPPAKVFETPPAEGRVAAGSDPARTEAPEPAFPAEPFPALET